MAGRFQLGGKAALVTGAARGIGYETARLLHERGASVVLTDLDQELTQQAADSIGERTLALEADATDSDALDAAVAATVERFGGVDVVVANAGVAPPAATLRVIDLDVFERVVEIDLLGVWRTVRACLPQIAERRGHVVVVASVYAFMNPLLAGPYAISKAGVEQMGRALRAELAHHGASASVAYFGFIDTKMVRDSFEDPIADGLNDLVPAWVVRRLAPDKAGAAIVSGIERRSPRIVAPGWWRIMSALRGLAGPLTDARLVRDERVREIVRRADVEDASEKRGGLAEPAQQRRIAG
jgi:NAD(P)-dependent dehydrogenase (short-subunit alcohol dehydrogenase family)